MNYKVNSEKRLNDEKIKLEKITKKRIEIQNEKILSNLYSKDDEQIIINMRANGKTYQNIADKLHRSYYGIVDKIRRMKKEGKIPS